MPGEQIARRFFCQAVDLVCRWIYQVDDALYIVVQNTLESNAVRLSVYAELKRPERLCADSPGPNKERYRSLYNRCDRSGSYKSETRAVTGRLRHLRKAALPLNFKISSRITFLLCTFFLTSLAASSAAVSAPDPGAARANNIGVALMNQQLPGKALLKFEEAHRAEPSSVIPTMNKGIALIYLRRLPEAAQVLSSAAAADPANPRVWYSLGLAQLDAGNQTAALKAFQHAAALDPKDADSHYYVGSIDLGLKDYDHAIEEFEKALVLSPLHASAQYGLARALQRAGRTGEARKRFQRFQQITQSKIGTIFSDNYGEQGRYATAQDMLAPPATATAMIPMTFVAAATSPAVPAKVEGAGACMLDLEGNGEKDILQMQNGPNAMWVHR